MSDYRDIEAIEQAIRFGVAAALKDVHELTAREQRTANLCVLAAGFAAADTKDLLSHQSITDRAVTQLADIEKGGET